MANRPPGRPKLHDRKRKAVRLSIRATPKEAERLRALAAEYGMDLSQYIVTAALRRRSTRAGEQNCRIGVESSDI